MTAYQKVLATLAPYGATLVAVTKTQPLAAMQDLYAQGQRIMGENRVQELVSKQQQLPADIEWHLIGHLQTNKVKDIAPFVHTIHAIDSWKLLATVAHEAQKHRRSIRVLLQFKIAQEDTKYGLTFAEAETLLQQYQAQPLEGIHIVGVMGMASFTDDKAQVEREFQTLVDYFQQLKQRYFAQDAAFKEISMGMSGDYELALALGSTMVRIGSLLFS